jgi:gliding motility-associated lipoprotein GldH
MKIFFSSNRFLLLMVSACMLAASCRQLDVYEKNVSIPAYKWAYSFTPGFDFEIKDTSAGYNILVVLRHTDAYRYNNIWINLGTQAPGDTVIKQQRLDLRLGADDKGWEGTGMDDIWEVRVPVTKAPVYFRKAGLYHFTLEQIMRENPLLNVMSAGVRVERVK